MIDLCVDFVFLYKRIEYLKVDNTYLISVKVAKFLLKCMVNLIKIDYGVKFVVQMFKFN